MKSTPFHEAAIIKFLPYLVVLLIIASYLNTLNSPAILDDEHSFIFTTKTQIKDLSLSSLNALKDSEFGLGRLIPITTLAINNYFSHGQASPYHITNISIHIAVLLSIVCFLKQLVRLPVTAQSLKILSPQYLVWAVAGLWALSPVQTNAVTYIVQRMSSLCALFYTLALALYLHARMETKQKRSLIYFAGAVFAAGCSFISKENSASLPIAILLLEDFFIAPGVIEKNIKSFLKNHWLPTLIFIFLVFPILIEVWHTLTGGYEVRPFTLPERLLTETRVVTWYMTLLLIPLPLRMNIDHDFMISHSLFSPLSTFFSLITITALLVYAIRIRRNIPLLSFGILFFFLNILIESSIIPLELVFEHRLYLSSIGFFLAILAIADLAISKYIIIQTESFKKIMILTLIILLAGSSLLTSLRNYDWRNEESIYRDMAEKSPQKPRPLGNYGMALSKAGKPEEGARFLNRAFSAGKPNAESYYGTTNNLLLTYTQLYGPKEAIRKTTTLMEKIPIDADLNGIDRLNHNLANLFMETNQLESANEYIKRALFLIPSDQNQVSVALCMEILGRIYDEPILRKKIGLSGNSKTDAVGERVILLLIDSRDYNKAASMIDELGAVNLDKSDKLRNLLKLTQDLNYRATLGADINNDQNYINDREFRWSIKAVNFINYHYRPFKLLSRLLVRRVAQRFPDDPFINLIYYRQLQEYDQIAAKELLTNKLLTEFPDFPPLLTTVIEFRNCQPDIAYRAGQHLLEIFPCAPDWKKIQLMLLTYRDSKVKKQAIQT